MLAQLDEPTLHRQKRKRHEAQAQRRCDCVGADGYIFLLSNLGLINVSLTELSRVWWPTILIVFGLITFFSLAAPKKRPDEVVNARSFSEYRSICGYIVAFADRGPAYAIELK